MFILDLFGTIHLMGHMLGKWNVPRLYWSREREEFSVLGCHWADWQPGWKYQQRDVVFVRDQFPVLGSYKHCHLSYMLSLSLVQPSSLADPHSPFSFIHSLFSSLSSLRPLHTLSMSALSHPSCQLWLWPIRQSLQVWCVCLVWPFQRRRIRRSGRGSRRRHRGEITDASAW